MGQRVSGGDEAALGFLGAFEAYMGIYRGIQGLAGFRCFQKTGVLFAGLIP